jgi:hypothetical protein
VAGSTSTFANSWPKSALSSEDFPAFTSPTTTKSSGSRISVSKPCSVSSVAGSRRISEFKRKSFASADSSSVRSCR